ncbi:7997_t:CDS:2, partial [Ambispora leptoticha]
ERGRAEAAVALKGETSDKGKTLHKAFSLKDVSEYSESKDKLDESIEEIKKHIALIEEIIKVKDTETSKLESRKTVLETAKKDQQNTGGGDGSGKPDEA